MQFPLADPRHEHASASETLAARQTHTGCRTR